MQKHLQILRNSTISTSREAAKTALLAQLAKLNDGELAINRYQDGTQVKVLFGFNNTVGTNTKQFVFDSDSIPADVQTQLDKITNSISNVDNTPDAEKSVKHAGAATNDDEGNVISSFIKGLSIKNNVITYTNGKGEENTIAVTDTNQTVRTESVTFDSNAAVKIVGSGATTVTADKTNNTITISSTDTDTKYTLPTATNSTLGGVKVGTNLSIANGVLSITTLNAGEY